MVDILTEVREKISCPQFGDDHYGEWGALPSSHRRTIKRLLDYSVGQEAEIERLRSVVDKTDAAYFQKVNEVDRAKAEAIKEFAERVKDEYSEGFFVSTEFLWRIDNLVKEMVGEL